MNAPITRITPELTKAYAVNRAAIAAARPVRSLAYERARQSAASLSHDEQIALAIHLIDYLEGVDDDARNAAVDAMGRLA